MPDMIGFVANARLAQLRDRELFEMAELDTDDDDDILDTPGM